MLRTPLSLMSCQSSSPNFTNEVLSIGSPTTEMVFTVEF